MNEIRKILIVLFVCTASHLMSQTFKVGPAFQKTQSFYWENGLAAEYSSPTLLNNHLHLQMTFLSSSLGTALLYDNAVGQSQVDLGADWHFGPKKPLQFFAGLQTGYFKADYEEPIFDVIPQSSLLMAVHMGLNYDIHPISVKLKAGYHLINGDGANVPGTLFPVYYQLAIFYNLPH